MSSSEIARPRFTRPETVLSPKGSVSDLRVLLDTGEDGWSVASMLWDGKPSLGIRWNGHQKNPIGNPQSRGIPTWFVLPDDLAANLRSRFGESLSGLNEDNSDITRVRLRPLPTRIWQGSDQGPSDDVWVLSITDRVRGSMEIMNPRTGHFMALHSSHVKNLVRDTVSDRPNGPKHGILSLNVQIAFEDGEVRLEPLQTLSERLQLLGDELSRSGYEGQHDAVRNLVDDARNSLAGESGALGPWEAHELDYAATAVRENFLLLALSCIAKAITVNRLPANEYDRGFNYGRQRAAGTRSEATDR